MLHRLGRLIDRVTRAYDSYTYHLIYQDLHNFCTVDLSNFYLDVQKDRLYCSAADDPARRSAQTVMMTVLECLTLLMAPILTFTAEELWQQLPNKRWPSVQLADWPEADRSWDDPELGRRWEQLLAVRDEVSRVLEEARRGKIIGSSLGADLILRAEGDLYRLLRAYREKLAGIFIVSSVELHEGLGKAPDDGEVRSCLGSVAGCGIKCPCWIFAARPELCPRPEAAHQISPF